MESNISLQELYQHPVVAEIISENKQLRATLSEKPDVTDLNDVPLPYTIKRHILINEGVHNGLFYSAQILRLALIQHEGLSLFLDHHPNDQGGTALTWCGSIVNPAWSEADKAIVGDLDVVDPKTAIALAYGAKFGVSATVDVDTIKTEAHPEAANDPVFKSYSIVLDPAVRETMLNENDTSKSEEEKGEVKEMSDELDMKSDLKPAMDKVDDAIRRASAMKDTSLLETLQQTKAILSKLAGTEYPYPKPDKMEELEGRFIALEQLITAKLTPSEPPSGTPIPEKNEELEAVSKENETLKAQLEAIAHEKLVVHASDILNKELEVGLVLAADSEARKIELEAMKAPELDALESNLDKTIHILQDTPAADDSKPDVTAPERKELSKDKAAEIERDSNQKLLDIMLKEQGKGHMNLGGY